MNTIPSALSALQQAGIQQADMHTPNLRMREIANSSLLRIRSLQAAVVASAAQAAGLELPQKPGESRGLDPVLMCLRPGEWLLHSSQDSAGPQQQLLTGLPPGGETAVLDFSDGLAVVRLNGSAAPWLLAKLSGLDFLGGGIGTQHCARTRMGQAAVVVSYHALPGAPSAFVYDLIYDRSIASYLWTLLEHSTAHAEELLAAAEPAQSSA